MMSIRNTTNLSTQSELMQRILEIRYTDLEEEKALCKQLLELSEAEQYFYGSAFANVYLMDSHLALGEYNSCGFYLMRANALCTEHGFDDLLLMLCHFAGLYYQKLNDDQTALSYFLEGKRLAEKLENFGMTGKIYNNIGYSFGRNGDLLSARKYFSLAYKTVEPYLEGDNIRNAISALSNLAEVCNHLGDATGTRQALERCAELIDPDDIYSRIRMTCGWCSYYAHEKDIPHCTALADKLIESDLLAVDEPFFLCDMAEGLCGNMLSIGDQPRAKRLLDIIEKLKYSTSLSLQHRMHSLKIQYWQTNREEDKLQQAYREYYEMIMKITAIEEETQAQNIVSKIDIHQATLTRETMLRQMQDLENASQLDELTGLYNRRYFNKLVSKIAQRDDVKTLGFIMLDVDYFKQYNDFYGHFKGDGALRTVAGVLNKNRQEHIYASRYGGDEFVCLCVNLPDEAVEVYTKQILACLKQESIPHEKHFSSSTLTISIGYCNEPFAPHMDTQSFLHLADNALYFVKNTGRGSCARKRFKH